jgi:hypothetical protein
MQGLGSGLFGDAQPPATCADSRVIGGQEQEQDAGIAAAYVFKAGRREVLLYQVGVGGGGEAEEYSEIHIVGIRHN